MQFRNISKFPCNERRAAIFEDIRALLDENFPQSELRPNAEFAAMPDNADFDICAAFDPQERLIGASILFARPESEICLLDYLVTSPSVRGQGVGSALLKHLLSEQQGRFMLIEVETPDRALCDYEDRCRRKAFYRRCGALEISGLSYILPVDGSSSPPPPMDMLVLSAHLPTSVPKLRLGCWLSEVYGHAYGAEDKDPRLARMLAPLPDEISLV